MTIERFEKILTQTKLQIENNTFDWERSSWVVAEYCPESFDPEKYNWERFSTHLAKFCPQHFDPVRFNWQNELAVRTIKKYAPHLLLRDLSTV